MDVTLKYEKLRDMNKVYLKSGSKHRSAIEKFTLLFVKQNKEIITTVCAKHIGARMVSLCVK